MTVFKSVRSHVIAAAGLTLVMATPALAQSYECNIRQRSWAGLISESYRFDVDVAKGRVAVLDPIIRFARGKPAKGVLEIISETETRVTWEVEDVPTAPAGGPTDARFEAVLSEGERIEVQVSAVWSDETEAGTGKGRCTISE